MKTYSALVTQDITQSTTIIVDALDARHAEELALRKARSEGHLLDWTLSDSPCSDPYFGDEDEDIVEIVRVPDEIATAWPDAPLPTVVVPAPDDPRYGQVFDLMLNICEGLKDARDFESTGDLNMAEGVWDEQINPKLDEVFKLLAPE